MNGVTISKPGKYLQDTYELYTLSTQLQILTISKAIKYCVCVTVLTCSKQDFDLRRVQSHTGKTLIDVVLIMHRNFKQATCFLVID